VAFLPGAVAGVDASPGPAPSPGSRTLGRGITSTPEQLKRVLDEFDEQLDAAAAATAAGASPADYGGFGAAHAGGGGALPAGTYRPSLVPKGRAAAPLRTDGRIAHSSAEQKQDVMRRLNVTQEELEVRLCGRLRAPLHSRHCRVHLYLTAFSPRTGRHGEAARVVRERRAQAPRGSNGERPSRRH
jgi:hypothetical protein